jgi:signal peptide peptidase SppA
MPTRPNLNTLAEAPWALLPATLARIVDWARQPVAVSADILALEGQHDGAVTVGGVAVIPVYGVIEYRSSWMMEYFGGCSVEGLRESLAKALGDPSITAIVLDIDSPGGAVSGVTELAGEIRAARGGSKPIVASVNTLCASAAAWIGLQADEVVITPSGHVGSIGVYAMHQDISKMLDEMGVTMTLVSAGEHKTEGNEFEPLSEDARADIQERVDATYQQFLADVAAGRRVAASVVEADYGGGRVLNARQALAAGMVDRIESIGQTMQRLSRPAGRRRAMAAEGDAVEIVAETEEERHTFSERLTTHITEAAALVEHAQERARLRAKEGRPAFSTTTEAKLRAIRDSIDGLLALDEPAPPDEPVEPAAPVPTPPVAVAPVPPIEAAIPKRFRTDEDWLRFIQET